MSKRICTYSHKDVDVNCEDCRHINEHIESIHCDDFCPTSNLKCSVIETPKTAEENMPNNQKVFIDSVPLKEYIRYQLMMIVQPEILAKTLKCLECKKFYDKCFSAENREQLIIKDFQCLSFEEKNILSRFHIESYSKDYFFMVFGGYCSEPTVKYKDFLEAEKEAIRLTQKHETPFYVLESIYKIEVKK